MWEVHFIPRLLGNACLKIMFSMATKRQHARMNVVVLFRNSDDEIDND